MENSNSRNAVVLGRVCMFRKVFLFVFLLPVFTFATVETTGKKLVLGFWKDMQARNTKKISSYMSPDFQMVGLQGIQNKQDELTWIKNADIVSYGLRDIQTKEDGKYLYVMYYVQLQAVYPEEGIFLSVVPAMTTFHNFKGKWILDAHACTY